MEEEKILKIGGKGFWAIRPRGDRRLRFTTFGGLDLFPFFRQGPRVRGGWVLKLFSGKDHGGYGFFLILTVVGLGSTFEIGTTNKYSYETTVAVTEKCGLDSESPVGHSLKANVHITGVWKSPQNDLKKLLKIEILKPKLSVSTKSGLSEHRSELNKLSSSASYVLWEDGVPKKIWDDPAEHYTLRNLKRGIVSFLQHRRKDQDTRETDVSGECDVIYKIEGNSIRRRKGNCIHSKFDKSLSQGNGIRSASTVHQSTTDCEWKDGKISKCKSTEYVKLYSNAWHRPSLCVDERSGLALDDTGKDANIFQNEDLESVIEELKKSQAGLEAGILETVLVMNEEKPKKRQLKPTITRLQKDLATENLATVSSVKAFYKLLPIIRTSSAEEILQVLKNDKFEDVMPQILDLVAACATKNCLKAAFEFFDDETEYNALLERFIVSLSILPRPSADFIKQLRDFLEKDRGDLVESSVLMTLGTILKTYAQNPAVADLKVIEDTRIYLEEGLKKCDPESEFCTLNYLRSLRNAALPRSARVFLEYAVKGGKDALEAVLGLKNIPIHLLPPENQPELLKVFHQIGAFQDRSTRAFAAELLLKQHPNRGVLKSILKALSNDDDIEFAAFLASKIDHLMSLDPKLRKSIADILSDKDINYYLTLAQKGQSSLFRRHMVSVEGTNVTYGLEMEMLEGGMLKRTVFDVSFENAAGDQSLLSVGLFASGLGSVAGQSSETEEEEDSNPTAGMNLGFLDSYLRPYVFFRSTSELMGHAWSGTASEQTPVLQCILSFSDDEKVVVLSNGMIVRGQLRGVLSADSSASAKISLWNRNSKSLVKSDASLLVRGVVTLDAGFVVTQGTIQFSGESGIDFKVDLDFYESPFTTCLQMEHPDVTVKSDVFRSVKIPATDYELKRTKRKTISIPGRSFAFNEKNDEMCQTLNSET
ncbi:Microsomal triglyceride transfer protein like [Argiope bruennichi]|uniref:Microsomal triglyceride transfer protein like n=1 Tax=Argiope bruennichi TaxID=94029 RepID=A0A8T0DYY4_ARGBR|nr:Microsomal triglyceride transfer protein like [Argiope bruennichi]